MSIAVEATGPRHSSTDGVAGRADVVRLRSPWRRLAAGDLAALLAAWALTGLLFSTGPTGMWGAVPIAVAGVWLASAERLYTDRVADMRSAELHGVMGVSAQLAMVAITVQWILPGAVVPAAVATGCALSLVGFVLARVVYRAWLRAVRASGRFGRPIVLIGIDDQARAIRRQLEDRPELGFAIAAALGSRQAAHRYDMDDLWAGDVDDAIRVLHNYPAEVALISPTALDPTEIDPLVRDLTERTDCQVSLTTGMTAIDPRRLRAAHLNYEPVVNVDRPASHPLQSVAKRAIDVALGSVLLLLALPVLAAAAGAIKLGDRGSVLFRQARVGHGGRLFTVYKLRTMTVDAETRLGYLSGHNERRGPLFKMEQDPRVTKVGSLIRDLSIDELPQLWNVLKGEMSLVGPRPALPDEVAHFGDRLRERNRVRPGLTGLWQVEARDNPSFHTYERLDLFYVENWSLALDFAILIATVESELARVASRFGPGARRADARRARPQLEPVATGHSAPPTNARVPVAAVEAIPHSAAAGR